MNKIILMVLLLFSAAFSQFIPVNLNDWTQEGLASNGNWSVDAEGTSVLQSVNGAPTFFVGPDTLINTIIRGKFAVETTSDNDFIGFVFGFNRPLGEEEFFDFILLDWKQGLQTFNPWTAQEGLTLSRVFGTVTGNLASGSVPWWGHEDTTMQVLGTDYGSDRGWADRAEYDFELLYETNRVRIAIDSVVIFDVDGEFPPGRFGFYNYSQPLVRYQGFSLNQFPLALDDSASTAYNTPVMIDFLSNDFDPDGPFIELVRVNQPRNGSAVLNEDSTLTYTPDSSFSGTDTASYVIADSLGSVDSAFIYIEVEPSLSISPDFIGNPSSFVLEQNYPNPFNPSTTIEFQLPDADKVKLQIFDIRGRHIQTLLDKKVSSGLHRVEFEAGGLPSGIYFYRVSGKNFSQSRKLILLK